MDVLYPYNTPSQQYSSSGNSLEVHSADAAHTLEDNWLPRESMSSQLYSLHEAQLYPSYDAQPHPSYALPYTLPTNQSSPSYSIQLSSLPTTQPCSSRTSRLHRISKSSHSRDTTPSKEVIPSKLEDHFFRLLAQYNIPLQQTNLGRPQLPWCDLPPLLSKYGLEIAGWPQDVPLPDKTGKHNAKGITELTAKDARRLYEALDDISFRPIDKARVRPKEEESEDDIGIRPPKKAKGKGKAPAQGEKRFRLNEGMEDSINNIPPIELAEDRYHTVRRAAVAPSASAVFQIPLESSPSPQTTLSKDFILPKLRDHFARLLTQHDIPIQYTNLGAPQLPWCTLPELLRHRHLEITGWPQDLPLPDAIGKYNAKGIMGLSAKDARRLYGALNCISFRPMEKVPLEEESEDDTTSRPTKKAKEEEGERKFRVSDVQTVIHGNTIRK